MDEATQIPSQLKDLTIKDETEEKNRKYLLQFFPFSTLIDSSFWLEIQRCKLDDLGLSLKPIDICASFPIRKTGSLIVTLNYESFQSYEKLQTARQANDDCDDFFLNGRLIIYNTKSEFDNLDKRNAIIDEGKFIWENICDQSRQKEVDENLELYLSRFFMIIYGDFKKYDFHYWCAYPTLLHPTHCFHLGGDFQQWQKCLTQSQLAQVFESFLKLPIKDRLYFVIKLKSSKKKEEIDQEKNDEVEKRLIGEYFEDVEVTKFSDFWSIDNIDSLENLSNYMIFFVFCDPSPNPKYPGWPLRNYLAYIYIRISQLLKQYQNHTGVQNFTQKILFTDSLQIGTIRAPRHQFISNCEPNKESVNLLYDNGSIYRLLFCPSNYKQIQEFDPRTYLNALIQDICKSCEVTGDCLDNAKSAIPPIVGWERNKKFNNRLVPNHVNCSNILDPETVSRDALYLNLKLMKWRLVPDLDLEMVKNTRCLLLGAGTLGCNVARGLVAWGIQKITFIDNRTVSYSNPARQSLYTCKDAIGGDKKKAMIAAEALKRIHPGIDAQGFDINIKMPGHPVSEFDLKNEKKEILQFIDLIREHDVLFLLTDTRESRWLPTVIGAAYHKIVINVALGFDTFLVQRHGMRFRSDSATDQQSSMFDLYSTQMDLYKKIFPETEKSISNYLLGSELGCYYCNDVFAPGNSTKDRTLDQQCTVTRPGLSMVASGYAVEMLVSMLQHPAKGLAPAVNNENIFSTENTIYHRLENVLNEMGVDTSSNQNMNQMLKSLRVESILGTIPHQIRGFLSRFEHISPSFRCFEYCVACSPIIIDKFRDEGLEFLLKVIQNSKMLEETTGLQKYHEIDDDIQVFDSDGEEEVLIFHKEK